MPAKNKYQDKVREGFNKQGFMNYIGAELVKVENEIKNIPD